MVYHESSGVPRLQLQPHVSFKACAKIMLPRESPLEAFYFSWRERFSKRCIALEGAFAPPEGGILNYALIEGASTDARSSGKL